MIPSRDRLRGSAVWNEPSSTEPAALEYVCKVKRHGQWEVLTGREKGLNTRRRSQNERQWRRVGQWCLRGVRRGKRVNGKRAKKKKKKLSKYQRESTSRRIIMTFICWCCIPRVICVAVPTPQTTPQTKTPTEKCQRRENSPVTCSYALNQRVGNTV